MAKSINTLKIRMLNVVTKYDHKQSSKKSYNIWALSQYYHGVARVIEAIDSGKDIEEALKVGFCGSLLRHIAKKLGIDRKYSLRE